MEGAKINKGPPGNNHKFVRNRRDDSSYNHPSYQDSAIASQRGKVSSVKPRSVDHTKHVDTKPGVGSEKQNDGNKQEHRSNFKGRDDQRQYGQKENRSNLKHDDRRKFNFSKEKTNARHFKQTSRNQSKGNEVTANNEMKMRRQPNKTESGVLKRNDNPNITSTPQHLKPAVHVQPLQQVPENTRATVEQNSNTVQTNDSSSGTSTQGNAEELQGISNIGKDTSIQISSSLQTRPEQASMQTKTFPGNVDRPKQTTDSIRQEFQNPASIDQNPLNPANALFPREACSLGDLNNSGLSTYLSSSISSSFGPEQDFLKPQSNPTVGPNIFPDGCLSPSKLTMTQNQAKSNPNTFLAEQNLGPFHRENNDSQSHAMQSNIKQASIDHSPSSFQITRDELEPQVPLQGIPDEKYGYRISVNSLFSTSFFTNKETEVKNNVEMTQDPLNDHNMVEKHKIQEMAVVPNKMLHMGETQANLLKQEKPLNTGKQHDIIKMKPNINTSLNNQVVKNQNYNEPLILPSQLPHSQLLKEPEYFSVENGSTHLHSHKHQKCNDLTVLSTQVSRSELLKKPQQLSVINPNEIRTNNPPLLHYQPPSQSQDNYKDVGNFDTRLVSPRNSKDFDKATLGSPPPVLRELAPRVNLKSECTNAMTQDSHLPPESSHIPTYRNFTSQDEKSIERLSSSKLSGFSRENSSENKTSVKPELSSEKPAEFKSVQNEQESMTNPALTRKNSNVPADSLVNLNYREIPKHSTNLQTDGFSENETKEPVSARCRTVSDNTTRLDKAELQSKEGSNKDDYKKNDLPLLHCDVEDNHVQQGSFPHAPFLPNPFLSHSLLTHRQAIPSAFVYPSRVGLAGSHSGFADIAQHAGANPGSHIFPPHGTTICLNVGGRIFEILPSTFSPYPESLLSQIFTGTVPAPFNQRGHLFFDRDGYLFEIILAFARVGYLTLPQNISLTSLKNESTFFGMYEYMFQKDKSHQISSGNILQFQRITRCTLKYDESTKKSVSRVFVLQGDDKLKIESLRVSGPCCLYVDLYTPLGVRETSNFVIYTPDKPDLWKAYQFCAERQLVFHLEQTHADSTVSGCNKSSAEIVFAQTFVFTGDQYLS